MNDTNEISHEGFNRPATALANRSAVSAASSEQVAMLALLSQARANQRDEHAALSRMLTSAKRPMFAEDATYSFPRGGQDVVGPSVSLARPLAAAWGNIDYGVRIVDETEDSIQIQGYAIDLETASRVTAEDRFKKLVQRKNKKSGVTEWVKPDERDMRELLNRRGAILERNCILKLLPPDIVQRVLDQCADTLVRSQRGNLEKSREDTIRDLVLSFDAFGVSKEMIEVHLGHIVETITADELVTFKGIWKSIRDGNTKVGDHFERPGVKAEAKTVTADWDAARPAEPKDPPGGSPITKAAAPKEEADPKPAPKYEPLPATHWAFDIEITSAGPPAEWLDQKIASKGILNGFTYREASTTGDGKVMAEVARFLSEGAALQREKGKAGMSYQRIAEACRLAGAQKP